MRTRKTAVALAAALLVGLSGGVATATTPATTPTVAIEGLYIDSYYHFGDNSSSGATYQDAMARCGARVGYGAALGWWTNAFCRDAGPFTVALYYFR